MSTFDSRYETNNGIDPTELPHGWIGYNRKLFSVMTDEMKQKILSGSEELQSLEKHTS